MATTGFDDSNDTLFGAPGVDDTIDGKGGTDTVTYAAAGGVFVDLDGSSNPDINGNPVPYADDTIFGGRDTLISIENVTGSAFDDFISGNIGGNVLDGGAGADQLFGGDGHDTLIGGEGFDQLFGENGNDNLSGDAGADNLDGGAGDDVLSGGAGDDVLTGSGGADVFDYSFTVTSVGGGGGETFRFTDFFAAHFPNGEVADGTSQGQFSSLYTKWLEMLIADHGLGTKVLDIGQNSGAGGTPVIANMTGEFDERESFTWSSGSGKKAVTHERWYSDKWSAGGDEETITSTDALDTILNFTSGEDKLDFSDITLDQFERHFNVAVVGADTVITMDGPSEWQLTLSGVTTQLAADDYIFAPVS
jgi:hypothetical protein